METSLKNNIESNYLNEKNKEKWLAALNLCLLLIMNLTNVLLVLKKNLCSVLKKELVLKAVLLKI